MSLLLGGVKFKIRNPTIKFDKNVNLKAVFFALPNHVENPSTPQSKQRIGMCVTSTTRGESKVQRTNGTCPGYVASFLRTYLAKLRISCVASHYVTRIWPPEYKRLNGRIHRTIRKPGGANECSGQSIKLSAVARGIRLITLKQIRN